MRLHRAARPSSGRGFTASILFFGLSLAPAAAYAGPPPRMVGSPTVGNPSFGAVANTMMYTVGVKVDGTGSDAAHSAIVGYASADDYTTCSGTTAWHWSHSQVFDTADTRSWTLYNFQPGGTYYYKVTLGTGPTAHSKCGVLQTVAAPTPTLPANLSYLNLNFQKTGAPFETKYMLVETDDCGASAASGAGARDYLVVADVVNESIVWYLDIGATSGVRGASGSGFRYQAGLTPKTGRILMTVGQELLFEWGFDGGVVNSYDYGTLGSCAGDPGAEGPCLHHDVFKSDVTGNTYTMATMLGANVSAGTPWEDQCGTDAQFVDDGYNVLDSSYAITSEEYLLEDYGYDPTVQAGPNADKLSSRPDGCTGDTWGHSFDTPSGLVDWTHANSLAASNFGANEVLDMSLKEWDQILRFDAATGDLLWTLSGKPAYSDWGTLTMAPGVVGTATFAGQHDAHAIASNTLMMLDNKGDKAGARALQVHLNVHPASALIEKTWAMVNATGSPLACDTEGSAEIVPGSTDDHVFVLCANLRIAAELVDPTGNSGTAPPLVISLPDGTHDPFCSSGGPADKGGLRGWHRAFPLATVGEF